MHGRKFSSGGRGRSDAEVWVVLIQGCGEVSDWIRAVGGRGLGVL